MTVSKFFAELWFSATSSLAMICSLFHLSFFPAGYIGPERRPQPSGADTPMEPWNPVSGYLEKSLRGYKVVLTSDVVVDEMIREQRSVL